MYNVLVLTVIIHLFHSIDFIKCKTENQYVYHFDRLENINGSGEILKCDFKVEKKSGSDSIFNIDGDIEQFIEIDEEWMIELMMFKSNSENGQYDKVMGFKLQICLVMKTVYKRLVYDKIKDYSNLPKFDKCPLPKATYFIKGYPFDASDYQIIFQPGYYRIEIYFKKDNIAKAGIRGIGSVLQKD